MDRFENVDPAYATGWLGDVLPGSLAALGVPGLADPLGLAAELAGVRQVVVLLVDGLGWHQIADAVAEAPTLAALAATSRPITCGFPSTTPTSLVSLGTGAASGAHGLLAFTSVLPGTDTVLVHTMWHDDPDPAVYQPVPLLFDRARAAGLDVVAVNRAMFAGTGLTKVVTGHRDYHPIQDSSELVAAVSAELAAGKQLIYTYHPEVDATGHEYGYGSPVWRTAMRQADELVVRLIEALPPGAALVVTADHGHLVSPPDHRIDLDSVPELTAGVRQIAGEPRVRHIHTVPGAEADVLAAYRETLGKVAWVGTRAEAVATGWYGPFAPGHAERLGDVMVICEGDWSLQATAHEPERASRLIGYHGARTRIEMEIPLLVAHSVAPGR